MITEKIFCGLDIGSQRIKASVVKGKKSGRLELLGAQESVARGLKRSSVVDLGEFAESIHQALKDLSRRSGVKLKDVQLGVGGSLVEPRFSKAVIPLLDKASKVITPGDIKKVNKQARLLGIKMEEEILHDFPQHYTIDDANRVLNPAGLYGRKLAVASLLVVAPVNRVSNIVKGVNQAGYEVSNIFFSSVVSARVSLTSDMIHEGCLLIDIGAGTTSLLFFKDGLLRNLDIMALGGDHFTGSIAEAVHLPFDLAEDIKKSHAAVLSNEIKNDGEILVKKEDAYLTIKRKMVCESIEPDINRLVGGIQKTLRFSHVHDKLNAGIVMVGGGALLSGLIEHIEKNTNLPVKLGKVNMDTAAVSGASIFTAAVGLAQAGLTRSFDRPISVHAPKHWIAGISNRMRELYEEYF